MPRKPTPAHVPRQSRLKVEGQRQPIDGSFHLGCFVTVHNAGSDSLMLATEQHGTAVEELKAGETAVLDSPRWVWSHGRARLTIGEYADETA